MAAPNPLAARRRTNSSSFSAAVPSSFEESVVSGAIANRLAILSPLLNLIGDQTTIDRTSVIPQVRRVGKGALGAVPTTFSIEHLRAGWWARASGAHSRDPLALPTLRLLSVRRVGKAAGRERVRRRAHHSP